jgi:hypothetical protein
MVVIEIFQRAAQRPFIAVDQLRLRQAIPIGFASDGTRLRRASYGFCAKPIDGFGVKASSPSIPAVSVETSDGDSPSLNT